MMNFLDTATKLLFKKCALMPSYLELLHNYTSNVPGWLKLLVIIVYVLLLVFLIINSVRIYNFYISLFRSKEKIRPETELSFSKISTRLDCLRELADSNQEQFNFFLLTGIRVKETEIQKLIDIYTETPAEIDWDNIKIALPWLSINDGINLSIRIVVIAVNILSAIVFYTMLYLSFYLQLTINNFSNTLILALVSLLLLYLTSYSLSQLRGFIMAVRIYYSVKNLFIFDSKIKVTNDTKITS